MKVNTILFPSSLFDGRKIDEDMQNEYEYFHYFPNVYQDIKDDTPGMIAVPLASGYSLKDIKKKYDRFMVKDYVKSVKGTDFPKYFTREVTDDEFQQAMGIYYQKYIFKPLV